ncbi:MAG TPA: tetratricopeptide repeat protein [Gammaproteobacteria bacterium]|nr:tetratricopeptide repeat protein [Gammaproteobacteria bacterium]
MLMSLPGTSCDAAVSGMNSGKGTEAGVSLIRKGRLDEALRYFSERFEDAQEDSDALYYLGVIFNEKKLPRVSREFIRSALAVSPGRMIWRESLARVYESLGEVDRAISEYRLILAESGDDGQRRRADKQIRYLEATRYARQRKLDQAMPLFEALAEEYPRDSLILYSLGVARMLTNQLDTAERLFMRVIAIDPDYANSYLGLLNLATVHEKQGHPDKAIELLQRVADAKAAGRLAEQAEIRINMMEVRFLAREGNLGEALSVLENILSIQPDNLDALTLAAELYQKSGHIEEETRIREHILRLQPANLDNQLNLALSYAENSRIRDAIRLLERVVEEHPGTTHEQQARNILKQIYATDMGQLIAEEMEEDRLVRLEAEVQRDPDNFEAHVDLVSIYLRRGEIDKARVELEHIVRLQPDYLQGRITLASVYDELGAFPQAIEQYAVAISLEEDFEKARGLAEKLLLVNARNLYVEGNLDLAIREFEAILEREPDNALAHFYVGLIHSTRQEVMKAASEYKAVLQLAPSHLSARLNLAMSFEMMNREEDAIGEYQKILQSNPSPDIAETARTRLRNAERRINGLMANMGYLMSYNTNTNLSDENPVEDFVSNLNFSLAYQYKMKNGLRWRLLATPSYEIFHEGQFDYLNTNTTLSATYILKEITFVGGYTYRTNMGLITGNGFSRSNAFFTEGFMRKRLPSILSPFSGKRVLTGISGNASYTDLTADDSPFFSAYISTIGVTFNQSVGMRKALNLGYLYVDNSNKEFVGSDYAYTSHGLTIGLEQGFPYGISGNFSYRYSRYKYKNPDSFSQFTKRRDNRQHNLVASASRRLKDNITVFASLAWTLNKSNLPVGFILDPEEIVLGQQSTSLSDYDRLVLSTGINVNF